MSARRPDMPPADFNMDGKVDYYDEIMLPYSRGPETPLYPPITLFTSGIGNPYFFTGRRLHFLETLHDSPDPEDPEANWQIQYNRARHYDPHHGRWLQRDPAGYVHGMNLYEYVRSNPVRLSDPYGLWGGDVHRGKTAAWAKDLDYPAGTANAIGAADEAIDGGRWASGTGPAPWIGDQSYHFDIPFGGVDSRMQHSLDHLREAKALCDWGRKNDDPAGAVTQLGAALHPLQDWVAHGDHGKSNTSGDIWVRHNSKSPQTQYGEPGHYPDDPNLDAVAGPNGRPAGRAITVVSEWFLVDYDYAYYMPENQRITLTERLTKRDLRSFRQYVKRHGKPCGRCRDYFGIESK